jgi:hypothetical protein
VRPSVLLQVSRSFKPLPAGINGACVRPFICVSPNVGLLAIAGRERFIASIEVTLVWSIPCVTSHVNLEAFFFLNK